MAALSLGAAYGVMWSVNLALLAGCLAMLREVLRPRGCGAVPDRAVPRPIRRVSGERGEATGGVKALSGSWRVCQEPIVLYRMKAILTLTGLDSPRYDGVSSAI
jgi:hypothetical protein